MAATPKPRLKPDPFAATSMREQTFEGVGTFLVPSTISRKPEGRQGWQVKGTDPSKFFADGDFGGPQGALNAASEHLRAHRVTTVKPRRRSALIPWSSDACRSKRIGNVTLQVPAYIYRTAGTLVKQADGTKRREGGYWRVKFNPPFTNVHDHDHGDDPKASLDAAIAVLKAVYATDSVRVAKVNVAEQEPWGPDALKTYTVDGVGDFQVPRYIQRIRRPNNRDGWQIRYGETARLLTDRDHDGPAAALLAATEHLKSVWQPGQSKACRPNLPQLSLL